jgi:hypothetical protein
VQKLSSADPKPFSKKQNVWHFLENGFDGKEESLRTSILPRIGRYGKFLYEAA